MNSNSERIPTFTHMRFSRSCWGQTETLSLLTPRVLWKQAGMGMD